MITFELLVNIVILEDFVSTTMSLAVFLCEKLVKMRLMVKLLKVLTLESSVEISELPFSK